MNPDEIKLSTVWGVLWQSSETGEWRLRSIHMSEDEAGVACDRETLRVVPLELAPVGTAESGFNAWLAAMKRADDQERETCARIVAMLRAEAKRLGEDPDAERYVYGPPFLNRAADMVARGDWRDDAKEGGT